MAVLARIVVVALWFTVASAVAVAKKDHIQYQIRDGKIASQAVNLGGWLVTEYWMTYNSPLYKGVPSDVAYGGEYAIMKYLGEERGTKQYEAHRSTWITEKDIAQVATTGLNTVRVSVGYWIVNDVDDSQSSDVSKTYARGSLKYLDKLINEWAVTHNLAVMVSLHAHEGSQNGMDHCAPVKMGEIGWANKTSNVESSFLFATFIADRYKDSPAFLGLNLMNEPLAPIEYNILFDYYKETYKAIRGSGNDCIIATSPLLRHQEPPHMADFMPCPEYYNVWHEWHVYYKWGWEWAKKDDILRGASEYGKNHFPGWTGNPTFIGEWSLATPDVVRFSNQDLADFAAVQLPDLEQSLAGWAFWAWRHDDEWNQTSGWSMRQLLEKNIIKLPQGTAVRTDAQQAKFCPAAKGTKVKNFDMLKGSDDGSVRGNVSFTPKRLNTTTEGAKPDTQPAGPQGSGAPVLSMVGASLLVLIASMIAC